MHTIKQLIVTQPETTIQYVTYSTQQALFVMLFKYAHQVHVQNSDRFMHRYIKMHLFYHWAL
jgi:hypothetical protein